MAFHHPRRRRGFTLVELLVVIGIIALLISILLPSLAKARKAANGVKCSANIRSIIQAMQIYAAQNNGSIAGSPWTTARYVYDSNAIEKAVFQPPYGAATGNYPSVIAIFDWMSPIARIMGVKFNEDATEPARLERFEQLRKLPNFVCPENEFLAGPFATSGLKCSYDLMPSYCTASAFLQQFDNGGAAAAQDRTVGHVSRYNPPKGYNVKTSKVGDPSRKVYIADGGAFSRVNSVPDVNLNFTAGSGGSNAGSPFTDVGPWSLFSNAWDRGAAAGNTPASGRTVVYDARIFGYRHGGRPIARTRGDTYRMNVGFFDGHVEAMGDLESSAPALWLPKGTVVDVNGQSPLDLKKTFGAFAPANFVVP